MVDNTDIKAKLKEFAKNAHVADEETSTSSKRATAAIGPIRIASNLAYLQPNTDGGYACYTAGATVTRTQSGNSWTCRSEDILTTELRTSLIQDIVPTAINILQRILLVNQVSGNFFADQQYVQARGSTNCVNGVPIPASMRQGGSGVPSTDYYVFVTARPSDPGNLASALACNAQVVTASPPRLGRPLIGWINFNPSELAEAYPKFVTATQFNRYVRVGVHELMHALGFSESWYEFFSDDGGNLHTNPLVDRTGPAGNAVKVLTLPRVVAFGQQHYNCPSFSGFEVENGGGPGTEFSHWELRLARNEIMVGIADTELIISNLTLNLFRDSGWYNVNYTLAEPFIMGYRQGCSFPNSRCNTWTQTAAFCSQEGQTRCTVDRRAKGVCDFQTDIGTAIPAQFQYFTNPRSGSASFVRDYCPIIEGYDNGYCTDSGAFPTLPGNESPGFPDSRCFDIAGASSNMACLRHRCINGNLEVLLSGNWVACTGTTVNWPGQSWTVRCATELCTYAGSGSDLYTYIPPPPSIPLAPGTSGAPTAPLAYYFTDDPFLFYGVIAAGVAALILLIVIIAMCCRRKK